MDALRSLITKNLLGRGEMMIPFIFPDVYPGSEAEAEKEEVEELKMGGIMDGSGGGTGVERGEIPGARYRERPFNNATKPSSRAMRRKRQSTQIPSGATRTSPPSKTRSSSLIHHLGCRIFISGDLGLS